MQGLMHVQTACAAFTAVTRRRRYMRPQPPTPTPFPYTTRFRSHHRGRACYQRQQQDPGLELPGQVAQLPDLTAVQRPAAGERQHGLAAELGPYLSRAALQPPERPVLRRPVTGYLAAQQNHRPATVSRTGTGQAPA